jgi:recombinational DNA repair ATPase RecF
VRVETRAGHGAGKPTEMVIDEYADRWAFLVENLGLELPADYGKEDAMNQRDAYVEKMKARLDEWNAELARLEARTREARADARADYQRALDDMERQRERAREQIRQMQQASEAGWQELRKGSEAAVAEMNKAWDSALKHFNK